MTTYEVTVTRDGPFWFINIPSVPTATQARALRDVEMMATEVISLVLDVPEDSIELDITIDPGQSVREHLATAERSRQESAAANAKAAAEVRAAARELAQSGATLREIGSILNVSHQRAQQLVRESGEPVKPARRSAHGKVRKQALPVESKVANRPVESGRSKVRTKV